MGFDLTVLGCSGTHPGPRRACSSYLFRTGDTQLLVDCGTGSTMNLQCVTSFTELDAILISHEHADHCVDLIGTYYALRFHPDGPKSIPLYAPPGVVERVSSLVPTEAAFSFRDAFPLTEVDLSDRLEVGPMALELFPSLHPVPTVSVRITCDGRTATYSADSGGGQALVDAARGADLFLCEASWQGDQDTMPEGLHLTAGEAGRIATLAGVGRLVLTHLWPQNDPDRSLEEGRRSFTGALALAEDNQVWTLS